MSQLILTTFILTAFLVLMNEDWSLNMVGGEWKTKYAWWPVVIIDTDGDRALLWREEYDEWRVNKLVVARQYKGGKEYRFMSPSFF